MVETHEYRGLWWLPADEEERLSGTLTVEKGKASLELLGHFGHEIISETETEMVASGRLAEQPRILGLSNDGKRLTLEGHQSAPYTEHFPGIPIATYNRAVTLVGKHFASSERILFDEIAIEVSDLNAWTQVRAIATKARTRRQKGGYHVWSSVSGQWKPVRDIEIPLARQARAFIHVGAQFSGIDALGRPSVRMSLEQNATLHLRFAKQVSLEEVFERVGHIRNFLSLAVGRPVAILTVTGYQDDYADERTKLPIPIDLLWGVPHNPDPPEKPREPRDMLFTLPEASPDISKVLRSWFAKQKRLEPVFNLFFGMLYHPDMYSDVRFLMYAQAVETYGYLRRRKPTRRAFAEQVRDVLASCRTVSRKIVGDDEEAFIEHLTLSRNYYTHYDPKKAKRAATSAGLLALTIQLQALIEMSLLRELGFSHRAIDETLKRVDRYRQIEHFKAYAAEEAAAS